MEGHYCFSSDFLFLQNTLTESNKYVVLLKIGFYGYTKRNKRCNSCC